MSRRWVVSICSVVLISVTAMGSGAGAPEDPGKGKKDESGNMSKGPEAKMPALAFKMKDIDGKERDLRDYYGQVVLIVNTASFCGLTEQYEGLEALYKANKEKGFVILGFPANNFGKQEPKDNAWIKGFCEKEYHVTFPMFGKVSVKGEDICELFKYLTSTEAGHEFGGEVKWNFNKFLVGRTGELVGRFEPPVKPDDEEMGKAIAKALKEKTPKDSKWKKGKGKKGGRHGGHAGRKGGGKE